MTKQTKQIRILSGGLFHKLMEKIENQFKLKHSFVPTQDQLCESIAAAIEERKLFG